MKGLALLGGEKAVTIDYDTHGKVQKVSENGVRNILKLIENNEISISNCVDLFEEKFARYNGNKYAVAFNNGTSSLIAAVFAIGIKDGDEVIVPSFSHWSTASCVLHFGGIPVFADIDIENYNLSIDDIEKKITSKTKAVIITHIFGNPIDFDRLRKVTANKDIKIIEDCSHAVGATWKSSKVGTLSDIGCFSLQGDKLLTAGEGGILVTNSKEYYEKAILLGRYEKIFTLSNPQYKKYTFTGLGYKFRPHPLGIAIADANLDVLDELSEIRNENAVYFEKSLKGLEFIIPQKVENGAKRQYSYHFAFYDKHKFHDISLRTIKKALTAEGVITKLCGMGKYHRSALFVEEIKIGDYNKQENHSRVEDISLPNSEIISESLLLIAPRFETQCRDLIEQYIKAFYKLMENVEQLKAYDEKNKVKDPERSLVNAVEALRIRNKRQ